MSWPSIWGASEPTPALRGTLYDESIPPGNARGAPEQRRRLVYEHLARAADAFGAPRSLAGARLPEVERAIGVQDEVSLRKTREDLLPVHPHTVPSIRREDDKSAHGIPITLVTEASGPSDARGAGHRRRSARVPRSIASTGRYVAQEYFRPAQWQRHHALPWVSIHTIEWRRPGSLNCSR